MIYEGRHNRLLADGAGTAGAMTRTRSIGVTEAECESEGDHDHIRCDPHCCDEIRCLYCDTVLALVTYQEIRKELAAQHENDVEYWIDKLKAWKARQEGA
jgi:hypothetical protein